LGINVAEKILLDGFSASGKFVNRFVILHPERVQAAVSGGVNGMATLPLKEIGGEKLIFPVGVGDVTSITGNEFRLNEYLKVPQFIYMGDWDRNDTLPYPEAFSEIEVELIKKYLGKEMMPDRWTKTQEFISQLASNIQTATYHSTEHTVKNEMLYDIVNFFALNTQRSSTTLKRINPYQYPKQELPMLQKVTVEHLFWMGDPNIPEFARSGTQDARLFLSIKEWIKERDHQQLKEFIGHAGFNFEVLDQKGKIVFLINENNFAGTVSDDSFRAFVIKFTPSQLSRIKKGQVYRLQPLKTNELNQWEISNKLRFMQK